MCVDDFEYDIAFSFLSVDEPIVAQVKNELGRRARMVFYTEREKETAFRDGEALLKEIYAKKSRTVAIFYRSGWGELSWTRMESDAIRDRAFHKSYDFVKFIRLDNAPPPEWVSKFQFFVDYSRWDAKSVAAVLEAHIGELGGKIGKETAMDRVARFADARAFEKMKREKRSAVVESDQLNHLVNDLYEEIVRILAEIRDAHSDFNITSQLENSRSLVVRGLHGGLTIQCRYTEIEREITAILRTDYSKEWDVVRRTWMYSDSESFELDLSKDGSYVWTRRDRSSMQYTATTLADYLIKRYLEWANAPGTPAQCLTAR